MAGFGWFLVRTSVPRDAASVSAFLDGLLLATLAYAFFALLIV